MNRQTIMVALGLVLSTAGVTAAWAQALTAAAQEPLLRDFSARYNAGDGDGIYGLFAPALAEALPAAETRTTFADLFRAYGPLVKTEVTGVQAPFVLYKAVFERGAFLLKLSVDRSGRIDGLALEAYDDGNLRDGSPTVLRLPFSDRWAVV